MDHIARQKDGKKRFLSEVSALVKTFSLTGAHDEAMKIKNDVLFFTTVKANFVKHTVTEQEEKENSDEIDLAMRQLVSKATMPVGVIDLLASK
jgi:type I restriction enzyme, R subunit